MHISEAYKTKFGTESDLAGMWWKCSPGLNSFRNLKKEKHHVLWDLIHLFGGGFKWMSILFNWAILCIPAADEEIALLQTSWLPWNHLAHTRVWVGETPANTKVFSWRKLFLIYHFIPHLGTEAELKLILSPFQPP